METDIWKNRGKLYASWRPNNQVMSKEGTVNLTILRRRSLSLNIEQLPLNTSLLIISSKLKGSILTQMSSKWASPICGKSLFDRGSNTLRGWGSNSQTYLSNRSSYTDFWAAKRMRYHMTHTPEKLTICSKWSNYKIIKIIIIVIVVQLRLTEHFVSSCSLNALLLLIQLIFTQP